MTADGPGTGYTFTTRNYSYQMWVWGDNEHGNLGLNAPEASMKSSPVQIPGTNWHTLHHGYGGYHMAATQKN